MTAPYNHMQKTVKFDSPDIMNSPRVRVNHTAPHGYQYRFNVPIVQQI